MYDSSIRKTMLKISSSFLEKFLYVLVFLSGICIAGTERLEMELPIKPILIIIIFLILIYTIYFHSVEFQIKTILASAFLGTEIIFFILPIIFLPKIINYFSVEKKNGLFKKWSFALLMFFVLAFVQLIVSNIKEFSFFTVFFWLLIFGFGFILFIYYSDIAFNESEIGKIFTFFKNLLFLQLIILFFQGIIYLEYMPGDIWGGSFIDADKAGFYLTLLLVFYFAPTFFSRKISVLSIFNINRIAFLIFILICIVLCDAKIKSFLLFSGIFLFSIFFIVFFLFNKNPFFSGYKAFIVCIISILFFTSTLNLINFYLVHYSDNKAPLSNIIAKYTYAPESRLVTHGVNAKYLLYKNIYWDLYRQDPLKWFWGEGPGKFNSRTSNMLAYDLLYKEKGQFKLPHFIPPYSSPLVKRYMPGVWTKERAEFIKWLSANFSFPFAGWITIKGEMGIIGVIFFLFIPFLLSYYLINKTKKIESITLNKWAIVLCIFWLSFPLQLVIDNMQEQPQIMYPMYLLTAAFLSIKT